MTATHSSIRRMSALAEQVKSISTKTEKEHVRAQEQRLTLIDRALPHLLQAENVTKRRLEAEREELRKELAKAKNHLTRATTLNHLRTRYRRLNMDPLHWRDEQGLPLLVIYQPFIHPCYSRYASLFECVLGNPYRDNPFNVEGSLPKQIEACYGDLEKLLDSQRKPNHCVTLQCEFDGIIPLEARQKMDAAVRDFKESSTTHIYLIAQASTFTWAQQHIVRQPDPDPLIVGWSELDPEALWLIAAFDVTTVEQLMLSMVSE